MRRMGFVCFGEWAERKGDWGSGRALVELVEHGCLKHGGLGDWEGGWEIGEGSVKYTAWNLKSGWAFRSEHIRTSDHPRGSMVAFSPTENHHHPKTTRKNAICGDPMDPTRADHQGHGVCCLFGSF